MTAPLPAHLSGDATDASAPGARWLEASLRVALDGPAGPFALDVELALAAGTFVALVGPSGAGKTTLLRLLAGIMRPDAGRLRVGETVWCDTAARVMVPTQRRSIGFVFQDYALFPNMTVGRNVAYAIGRGARGDEVMRLLDLVGLQGLAGAYPARLSGGQRQRLALVRALARRPALLMLDEPLSALDPAMRRHLQEEIARLHRQFETTTVLISHDVSEILRLADRVIRLEEGRVVYDGAPAQAFGATVPGDGLRVTGLHVSGPDLRGLSTVQIEGHICRVRYRTVPDGLAPGDPVMIWAEGVEAHRLG